MSTAKVYIKSEVSREISMEWWNQPDGSGTPVKESVLVRASNARTRNSDGSEGQCYWPIHIFINQESISFQGNLTTEAARALALELCAALRLMGENLSEDMVPGHDLLEWVAPEDEQ